MKKWQVIALLLAILLIAVASVRTRLQTEEQKKSGGGFFQSLLPTVSPATSANQTSDSKDEPRVSVFATGLEVPWAIAFLPDRNLLVTERTGRVRLVTKDGQVRQEPVVTIGSVKQISEGGLHGITLHPDFSENGYVYLYYTYSGSSGTTLNRVVRYRYNGSNLKNEEIIVDEIPGAANHDGGRIKFGSDKFLYITTGDAQISSLAQETNSLAGKILRVTDMGYPVPGNPFGNRVYSYGHRNPQGIAWDDQGRLWQTEHGPSGAEKGNDEFNRVESGKNYGWPEIRGTQTRAGMLTPIIESGRSDTWAPAGLAYLNGTFYFAGLRGAALYQILDPNGTPRLATHFKSEFGRLREVVVGPDGLLYVTTSNRDGRGSPKPGDDKILRVNPEKL